MTAPGAPPPPEPLPSAPPPAGRIVVRVAAELAPLIDEYLANRRADVRVIADLLTAGDYEGIWDVGHNMKGAGAAYGFAYLTDLGAVLEEASRRRTRRRWGAASPTWMTTWRGWTCASRRRERRGCREGAGTPGGARGAPGRRGAGAAGADRRRRHRRRGR